MKKYKLVRFDAGYRIVYYIKIGKELLMDDGILWHSTSEEEAVKHIEFLNKKN